MYLSLFAVSAASLGVVLLSSIVSIVMAFLFWAQWKAAWAKDKEEGYGDRRAIHWSQATYVVLLAVAVACHFVADESYRSLSYFLVVIAVFASIAVLHFLGKNAHKVSCEHQVKVKKTGAHA